MADNDPLTAEVLARRRNWMTSIGFVMLAGATIMTLSHEPMRALAMAVVALVWFVVARLVTA